jgi:tetratricopeptide (TPR) repeat protein
MDRSEAAYRRSLKSVVRHLEFNADDSRAFYLGSTALLELGDREKAVEWAMRALSLDPDDPYNLYGVACFYSRFGDVEESIRLFEKALERGFSHREWIEHDSDLDLIRGDPRFQSLLKKLK